MIGLKGEKLTPENNFVNQVSGREKVVKLMYFLTAEKECKLVCAPVVGEALDKAEVRRERRLHYFSEALRRSANSAVKPSPPYRGMIPK